ncbi:hypothetical protein RRG08_040787 [Elysia crispata]|uniref:Uncharacterized protein n=1 Tax=Elysia crispata TaxID=231223 RepID=A0AAE1BEA4_9GAST|nr:hypothetical protein RRG08_040787 [Elysia crispata]
MKQKPQRRWAGVVFSVKINTRASGLGSLSGQSQVAFSNSLNGHLGQYLEPKEPYITMVLPATGHFLPKSVHEIYDIDR